MDHDSNLGKRRFIGAILGLSLLGLGGAEAFFGSSIMNRAFRPVTPPAASPIEITPDNFSQKRLADLVGRRVAVRGWMEFAWRALIGNTHFLEEDRVRLVGLGRGPYLHIMRSGTMVESDQQADPTFIGKRALVEGIISTKDETGKIRPAFLALQGDPRLLDNQ